MVGAGVTALQRDRGTRRCLTPGLGGGRNVHARLQFGDAQAVLLGPRDGFLERHAKLLAIGGRRGRTHERDGNRRPSHLSTSCSMHRLTVARISGAGDQVDEHVFE